MVPVEVIFTPTVKSTLTAAGASRLGKSHRTTSPVREYGWVADIKLVPSREGVGEHHVGGRTDPIRVGNGKRVGDVVTWQDSVI